MNWIALAYSLPTDANTPRVTLWRRLQRLGAISPTGSLYLLPAGEETAESFQWLAAEIRHAGGESLVLYVPQVEGISDAQLVTLFSEARREEYGQLAAKLAELERQLGDGSGPMPALRNAHEKLQRRYEEIRRIDYFHSPHGTALAARLSEVGRRLAGADTREPEIERVDSEAFRGRRWVTRPRLHVDRLACAWLIRRFIDPHAEIRYALKAGPDEVAFDMSEGGFSHTGNLCTFETMLYAFGLEQPALETMAEVVHEIDLRDGRYARPETAGIDAVLQGWLRAELSDEERETRGIALFEGLYFALVNDLSTEDDDGIG